MESKSLLFGIVGFIAGGFIVSIAATTSQSTEHSHSHDDMSMSSMTESLKNKSGDEFDREFITQMIAHHQGAVDMAAYAQDNAKHDEIKQLSASIITTQTQEINNLKTWQKQWGYTEATSKSAQSSHSTH